MEMRHLGPRQATILYKHRTSGTSGKKQACVGHQSDQRSETTAAATAMAAIKAPGLGLWGTLQGVLLQQVRIAAAQQGLVRLRLAGIVLERLSPAAGSQKLVMVLGSGQPHLEHQIPVGC